MPTCIRLFAALLLAAAVAAGEPAAPALAVDAVFERVLALNQVQEPELDLAQARAAFATLAAAAGTAVAAAATPAERVAALNRVLLVDREVSYLSNQYWRDSTLAAGLLRRRGNCLATSTLYVLVARRLGLPVRLVPWPRHVSARWDDGTVRINIETTSGGRSLSDAEYLAWLERPEAEDITKLGWGRSLDDDGFLAELLFAAAAHRVGENRLDQALVLFTEAERLAPQRSDLRLRRIAIEADQTKDRATARLRVAELLERGEAPPSVATAALEFLASDAEVRGDLAGQRQLLLAAWRQAPRTSQQGVLQSLAFCHRALKDWRGAVRYYELALALEPEGSPEMASHLYNYAILLKHDGRLDDALATVGQALRLNPESWNLRVIEAGYLVLAGQVDEGRRRFAAVSEPRGDREFWLTMQAWFHAVARDRAAFYRDFARALTESNSARILAWIGQDVDLDHYRSEDEFRALVERHRARLLGQTAPPPVSIPAATRR